MGSTTETVQTKVTADASQAVGEWKRVADSIAGAGQAAKGASGAANDFFSGVTGSLAKFNLALGGIEKGMGLVKDAMDLAKFSEDMKRMERAVPVETLNALRNASRGLATDVDLMRAAIAGMNGDFAMSRDEMTLLTATATALAQRSLRPLAEVMEILIDATRGKIRKLDDLGIAFEATKDPIEQRVKLFEKFHAILSESAPYDTASENLTRTTTTWTNQIDQIKKDLGEVAEVLITVVEPIVALAGVVARLLKYLAGGMVGAAEGTKGLATGDWTPSLEGVRYYGEGQQERTEKAIADERARNAKRRDESQLAQEDYDRLADDVSSSMSMSASAMAGLVKAEEAIATANADYELSAEGVAWSVGPDMPQPALAPPGAKAAAKKRAGGRSRAGAGTGLVTDPNRYFDLTKDASTSAFWTPTMKLDGGLDMGIDVGVLDHTAEAMERGALANKHFQESLQGISEEGARMSLVMGAANDALMAGVDAAISGSESIASAVLKSISSVLRGIAIQEAIKSLADLAEAFTCLATPGFQGNAGGLFLSSAKHAAAAAAAGVGAAKLLGASSGGGGRASSASGGAGGGYYAPRGTGSAGGGETIIVQVGEGFVGDAHALAEAIDRKLRAGKRAGVVRDGRGAVTFA